VRIGNVNAVLLARRITTVVIVVEEDPVAPAIPK
jgi:hypothetical protein